MPVQTKYASLPSPTEETKPTVENNVLCPVAEQHRVVRDTAAAKNDNDNENDNDNDDSTFDPFALNQVTRLEPGISAHVPSPAIPSNANADTTTASVAPTPTTIVATPTASVATDSVTATDSVVATAADSPHKDGPSTAAASVYSEHYRSSAAKLNRKTTVNETNHNNNSNTSGSLSLLKQAAKNVASGRTLKSPRGANYQKPPNTFLSDSINDIKEVTSAAMDQIKLYAAVTNDAKQRTNANAARTNQRTNANAARTTTTTTISHTTPVSLVQDLLSPFTACSTAGLQNVQEAGEENTVAVAVAGGNFRTKFAEKSSIAALYLRQATSSYSGDDSAYTMDTREYDDAQQMQRIGSWDTFCTAGTAERQCSSLTDDFSNGTGGGGGGGGVQDDDGNAIDPVLLEQVGKRRGKLRARSRKIVSFDYPPVSSIKACPRPAKEDLPRLFFTEEELDQIEDDRCNTKIADDVEVVAVASAMSDEFDCDFDYKEEPTRLPDPSNNRSPTYFFGDKNCRKNETSNNPSNNKSGGTRVGRWNSKRIISPPPSPLRTDSEESSAERLQQHKDSEYDDKPRLPDPSTRTENAKKDPRLIKGVQIYLRERSLG